MKHKNNWKERGLLMLIGICSVIDGLVPLFTLGYFNPNIKLNLFCSDWFEALNEWVEK